MFRVLTPGGTIAITDNDPRSPVIQRLPKPIAMLMVGALSCVRMHGSSAGPPASDSSEALPLPAPRPSLSHTHIYTHKQKSTEPFSDEYFSLDIEALLQEIGFTAVETVASDPRHRTILATKPKA